MPQINRIRVNNVKYNFGTQFYDDFVMRFSCRNTIYDLANGGGKSVLMLLLMQNLIPNCTLDEKQPVEKLFRGPGASTTIHSLIEWKLDDCDRRDGYKYMTTGFCARKARESEAQEAQNEGSAGIEYFNYCIFYKEYGANDIKNLPLVSDGERITYNGLKSYLRDVEKKDLGVEVHIFDRKGDYQSFISRYGLYESQWEIIRGINKTEGHVRTYFENSYRTTRKVVEDLLIEEIIEKSYNNRIRLESADNDDMARTLLDIRDRLSELTKKKSERDSYTRQTELITAFSKNTENFEKLYEEKGHVEKILTDCYAQCRMQLKDKEVRAAGLEKECRELDQSYDEAQKMALLAEIEEEYRELDKLNALISDTEKDRDIAVKAKEHLEALLRNHELAGDYDDYLLYKRRFDETKAFINSATAGDGAAVRLAELAAAKAVFFNEKKAVLSQRAEELRKQQEKLETEYREAGELHRQLFGEISGLKSLAAEMNQRSNTYSEEIGVRLSQCGLLVAEGIGDKVSEASVMLSGAQEKETEYRRLIDESDTKERILERQITECTVTGEMYGKKRTELYEELESAEDREKLIAKMSEIYGGAGNTETLDIMCGMLASIESDRVFIEKEQTGLSSYAESIRNHKIPDYDVNVQRLMGYIREHYDDVVSGKEYLETMKPEDAAKAVGEFPILPYVIIAGDSFDRLMADEVISSFNLGLHVVPIIHKNREQALSDIAWAYKKLDFLWDDGALNAELLHISEQIEADSEKILRLSDKEETVRNDILNYRMAICGETSESVKDRFEELEKMIIRNEEDIAALTRGLDDAKDNHKRLTDELQKNDKVIKDAEKTLEVYDGIIRLKTESDALNARLSQVQSELSGKQKEYRNSGEKADDREKRLSQCRKQLASVLGELDAAEKDFDENYKPYIDEAVSAATGLSEEETDAEAGALRKIISGHTADTEEHKKLLGEYDASMKKCIRKLEYGGISLSDAEMLRNEGKLVSCGVEEMMSLKDEIKKAAEKIAETDGQLEAQNAQKNRIQGGLDHEVLKFTERFGAFDRVNFDNPSNAVLRYRQEMSAVKEKRLSVQDEIKKLESDNRDTVLMERDLERILRNAGLELPDEGYAPCNEDTDIEKRYRLAQEDYGKILHRENAMRSSFAKDRQTLSDDLGRCGAYELADEIRTNVSVPESVSDVKRLIKGFSETCECILLERDRVEKSMSDMQQIKESFENRCLQICSNIKTELDRLPKLSRITLDGQVIPIVTLSVPYIRDDMYREKMSLYIDETVAGAETFGSQEEKLRYIRNRLSWKKLFSVIVTDMNSIKLSLYKREHIKDQSRYLRYEEAVGSTGQSQGIYIQFLIAIINYISSINSLGRDTAVTGKTIFIDNPFGAAKDVYIWEPIFKMLKTNHVQLVVPARGVTPAITKMFDVNYVLGQKMTDGRQQTVVADYRSQVDTGDMEYTPLEYHQGTFDFEHLQM